MYKKQPETDMFQAFLAFSIDWISPAFSRLNIHAL